MINDLSEKNEPKRNSTFGMEKRITIDQNGGQQK